VYPVISQIISAIEDIFQITKIRTGFFDDLPNGWVEIRPYHSGTITWKPWMRPGYGIGRHATKGMGEVPLDEAQQRRQNMFEPGPLEVELAL
jgi:hypothetical protein